MERSKPFKLGNGFQGDQSWTDWYWNSEKMECAKLGN